MTVRAPIFLSYSRNDRESAECLRAQMENRGFAVFQDNNSIRVGDHWLERLQQEIVGCSAFVVLVGRDGVQRWMAAETEAALNRHFGPRENAERLPIFPVLLPQCSAQELPAFLSLFFAITWDGCSSVPGGLLDKIEAGSITGGSAIDFEGCPFVGLEAFGIGQARLFFGRQKETLDALACFELRPGHPQVRWLEINGHSGSGKSSLMCAGLLPLIGQGWLWPRTRIQSWLRIGPMMPGRCPITKLAETLARFAREVLHEREEMADIRRRLEEDDTGLAEWLRSRGNNDTAFLLALDQFEELFTFSVPGERTQFDRLLATALADNECPLYLVSTVRSDFLDRFGELPCLVDLRNRRARGWTLPPIGEEGLREIIRRPASLAGLDVSEVLEEIVDDARNEPGALPLVQNALHWLWYECRDAPDGQGGRLSSRKYHAQGRLAGILSHSADELLMARGKDEQKHALDLMFHLVRMDMEGHRHIRRRIPLAAAVAAAGKYGEVLVNQLAGGSDPEYRYTLPLRLITITDEFTGQDPYQGREKWVTLIHETLISSKGRDERGNPQPYWPQLWNYLEQQNNRAMRLERLRLQTREWQARKGFKRLRGLAGWSGVLSFCGLALPSTIEQRYVRWSCASVAAQALLLLAVGAIVVENGYWLRTHNLPLEALLARWFGAQLPLPDLTRIPPAALPPPYTFTMGSPRGSPSERPAHPVTFSKPFYMGVTEVTFAQYEVFLEAMGRGRPSDGDRPDRAQRPVTDVTWNDARDYAAWLEAMTGQGCRLPSEAEWEFAARAGTATAFALPAPGGSDDIAGKGLANCRNCGGRWNNRQTAPVKSFEPNGWGLFDMHGNVSEWVQDCWHQDYDGAPGDGRPRRNDRPGECRDHVVRGGSWIDFWDGVSSARRGEQNVDEHTYNIGFRVLCASPLTDPHSASGPAGNSEP